MVTPCRYNDGMTNTATHTTTETLIAEKAKAFLTLSRELIDLCDEEKRALILLAVKSMVEMANECDRLFTDTVYDSTVDDEREKAWAAYYADYGKGE